MYIDKFKKRRNLEMMTPTNMKIASLPIPPKTGFSGAPTKPGKGDGRFLATIQGLMGQGQKNTAQESNSSIGKDPGPRKGYALAIRSLRNALLAKGKQLGNLSLKSEDLPVLKEFLLQIGFSQGDVEKLLKDLTSNHPNKGIPLSKLFMKLEELAPAKENRSQPVTLDPSAVPYLESALRRFGLTPSEVDHALSAAKAEDGGLDLGKLAVQVRGINGRAGGRSQPSFDRNESDEILKKLKSMGIQIPDEGKGGRVSIQHFVRALEAAAGMSKEGNPLSDKMKTTIDRMLEKVVVAEDRPRFSPLSSSELKAAHLSSLEKISGGKELPDPQKFPSTLSEEGGSHAKGNRSAGLDPSTGSKKGPQDFAPALGVKDRDKDFAPALGITAEKKDSGHSVGTREGALDPSLGLKKNAQNLNPTQGSKGGGTDSHTNQGPKSDNQELVHGVKSETRPADVSHNSATTTFSEAIQTAEEGQKKLVRHPLPLHVIDQVGKQISRSILRGDKVIRFQLKPPDLGFVRVEMDIKDNVLKLGLIAEHRSVKEMMLSHVQELKEALAQQGVKLERVEVQINHNFDQSLANSKEGLKDRRRAHQEPRGRPFGGDSDLEAPEGSNRRMAAKDRLLDLVA